MGHDAYNVRKIEGIINVLGKEESIEGQMCN